MMLMACSVAFGIGCSYFFAFYFFHLFFKGTFPKNVFTRRSFLAASSIFIICLAITFFTWAIPDKELGNRILHTFAGGFLVFIACFCAAQDSKLAFSRFQFVSLAVLLVTALGVFNELVEFFLQSTTVTHFAYTITDTWLDLVSNTVGCVLGTLTIWHSSLFKKH